METPADEPTIWTLMDIGHAYARLGPIRKGRRLGPTRADRLGLVTRLEDFCRCVEDLQLSKSRRTAAKIQKDYVKRLQNALSENADAKLFEQTAAGLRRELTALWDQLVPEASAQRIYIARPFVYEEPFRRFIKEPRAFLNLEPRGHYEEEWPEELDENLQEAARLLSVGFWAGAMLFTVRTLEGGLKHYLKLSTGTQPGNDPWGPLCARLDHSGAPDNLVNAIRIVKNQYRDPLAHITGVNLAFDEHTTVNLLNSAANAMGHMEHHLLEQERIALLNPVLSAVIGAEPC
ncbi:MAG: hypothetical protein JW892_01530 [Anaerolineae bacterium]|nr:hypothetical protein [Anaerolineae bacterium]